MKLDTRRWLEAVRTLEAELRALKLERRKPRPPGEKHDDTRFFRCRAEVTRLYCLRRHLRSTLHTAGRLWRVRGEKWCDQLDVRDLESQAALVCSVQGWLESFVVEEVAAGIS